MAAFSYQPHHPFLLDSSFFPNPATRISVFSEEPNTTTPIFSQFHQSHPLQDVSIRESSILEHNNPKVSHTSNNEPCVTNKHSTDSSSMVLDKLESGEQVTQKRKYKDGSSLNSSDSKDTREVKGKKQKNNNGTVKGVEEKKSRAQKKKISLEEAPTDYIHVRARRGQATDSHSLAERVRREKISARMKLLQALVPGCDKVTGKAIMLDEIINYVQSLQNQVEFLSMKLASVNPMFYDFGMDLDTIMVRPERLSSLESPVPHVQQISLTQPTANSYPFLDTSASLQFLQGQMTNIQAQGTGQLLWDLDGQSKKVTSQFGFSNLCSFH